VRDLVGDLAAGGTTVVLTGHDVDEIERLADRVALLADGSVVAAGSPTALVRTHGGDPRLVVETDADPGALPGYAAATVEDGLALDGLDPGDIGAVVGALDDHGVEYDALRWSRPSLEDVYLRLTGAPELAGAVGAGDLNRVAAVAGTGESAGATPEADGDAAAGGER
jgi:ABC-2 type transport system ATP-binding protein